MLAFLVVRDFAVGSDGRHGVYLETDDVIALANNDLSLPLMVLEVSRLEPLLSGPSLNEGEKLNEEAGKLLAERDHFAYLYDMEKEQNGSKLKRLELKVLRQGRRLQKADSELKAVYAQLNALAPHDPDSQADLFGDGAGATAEQLLVQLHAERDAGDVQGGEKFVPPRMAQHLAYENGGPVAGHFSAEDTVTAALCSALCNSRISRCSDSLVPSSARVR